MFMELGGIRIALIKHVRSQGALVRNVQCWLGGQIGVVVLWFRDPNWDGRNI